MVIYNSYHRQIANPPLLEEDGSVELNFEFYDRCLLDGHLGTNWVNQIQMGLSTIGLIT